MSNRNQIVDTHGPWRGQSRGLTKTKLQQAENRTRAPPDAPMPVHQAVHPARKKGTSAPSPAASPARTAGLQGAVVQSVQGQQGGGGVGAAPAQPGGHGDALDQLKGGGRFPAQGGVIGPGRGFSTKLSGPPEPVLVADQGQAGTAQAHGQGCRPGPKAASGWPVRGSRRGAGPSDPQKQINLGRGLNGEFHVKVPPLK